MKHTHWMMCGVLCGFCAITAQADEAPGPTKWVDPTQAPVLSSSIDEKECARQLAAVEAKNKPEQISADTPWTGVLVTGVDADSQAQSLGIKPGDVLFASNGHQIYDGDDWARHRKANDRSASVWSPTGDKRDVDLAPGLIGVDMGSYFRPEVLYLRELPAGDGPDPAIFAAAACVQTNPDLTREILSRVQQPVGSHGIIYLLDAIASVGKGNFDDALASGMWAIKDANESEKHVLAPLMRSAALASFRLELAAKLEQEYPSIKENTNDLDAAPGTEDNADLNKTIRECSALSWTDTLSCADAFDKLAATNETANMANAGVVGAGGNKAAESIRKSGGTLFNAQENQQNLYELGPTASNVKFAALCRFTTNAKTPKNFTEPTVRFGLSLKGKHEMPISVTLSADGTVDVDGTNIPAFSYQLVNRYKPGKPFDVAVIAVGNRCEVDIAGVRAYYGPILEKEKTRKLCFVFQAVGVKGQLSKVNWENAAAQP